VASGTGFGRVRDHPNRKPTSRGLLPTPIGELLGESGKLDPKELEGALRLQRETGDPLGSLLVQLGFVSERDVAASLGQALWLEASDAERLRAPAGCGHRLSVEFMKRYQVIPVGESDGTVDVAMADPTDTDALQALEPALGRRVRPLVALGADIQSAVQALWGGDGAGLSVESVGLVVTGGPEADDIGHLRDVASEAPVIRAVNQLVARALEMRSSDIHRDKLLFLRGLADQAVPSH
jgi:general secretion pathway protein E